MEQELNKDFQLGDYVYSSFLKQYEDIGYIAKINDDKEYRKYVVCQNGKLKEIFSKVSINPIKITEYFLRSNGYTETTYIPKKENEFWGLYLYKRRLPHYL